MGSETPNQWGLGGVGEAHSAGAEFIFAQLAGRRIEGDVDKALDEFTDLRKVTTASGQTGTASAPLPGAPLSAPSAASDPLGSIVREHLDRASSPSPLGVATAPVAEHAAEPIEETPVAEPSAAQQSVAAHAEVREENIEAAASAQDFADEASAAAAEVQEVQKEFAELFDGDAKKIAEAPREPAPAGEALPENSKIDLEEAALSQAEFDALLNKPETPVAENPPADEATESAIKSAEGVLEEELMQLMAEAPPAKAATPKPAEAPAPQVESPKAEVQSLATPENIPAPLPAPIAESPAVPAAAPASAPAAPAAMPTAPAGMSAPPVVVIEAPEESEEEVEEPQRGNLFTDILVMIGQLIDMPFRAISSADKNIIGIAAFLLLMGGVALWVIATFFFQPRYDKQQTPEKPSVHVTAPKAPADHHAPAATAASSTTSATSSATSSEKEAPHKSQEDHTPKSAPSEHSAPAHSGH
jgi:hypothetical protein